VLGVLLHQDGSIAREHTFMDGAYTQLATVDDLVADDDLGILFAGVRPEEMPRALCHPNTHRIVASPLAATFGRRFLNLGVPPYSADPQPDGADLDRLLADAGDDEAYLLQVAVGDDAAAPIVAARHTVTPVGERTLVIPLLDRPLDSSTPIAGDPIAGCARHGDPAWTLARFTISVSRVTS
jgi:hypothetical protein